MRCAGVPVSIKLRIRCVITRVFPDPGPADIYNEPCPKLMKAKDLHQSIADKYHVQIRGIHGEHTETDDGVFDISNMRRLGRNEVQLVQDMYDGVKAMIRAEKSL